MIVRRLLQLAALLALAHDASAELRITLGETSPAMPAVVAVDESVFLRIEYSGAEQSRLWAAPYYQGQAVRAKTNASRSYDGSGSALAWFELSAPGRVDEVRIRSGGGRPYKEAEVARFPVDVSVSGDRGSAASPRAQWVADLIAEDREISQKARTESQKESKASDMLIFSAFGFAVLGFIVLCLLGPLWVLWKWRGGWRMLGALPLAVMAVVIGRIVIDTSRDPTSHNLWPFEVLMFGLGGTVFFSVLVLVRRLVGRTS